MTELLSTLAAGTAWVGVFLVLAGTVRRRAGTSRAVATLLAYPAFFAGQVLLALALDATGLLATAPFRVAYGLALVVGGALLLRSRPRPEPGRDADLEPAVRAVRRILGWTLALLFTGLGLFTLVAPVHIWDALAYHMPMVASYVQNASLDAWPTQDLRQVYRVNAGELQMLNVALLAGSDAWVELPNLLALVVVLAATLELGRLALRHPALPWLAVLLVVTAPQIVVGSASEKNDLVFTAALVSAFFWIIRAERATGWRTAAGVILAALSSALAGATKVMGLNVVGAVGLLAVVLAARRRLRLRYVFLFGCAVLVFLLLLAGNVYLFNIGRSAVPVGIAPDEIHFNVGLVNLTEAASYYVLDLTLKRLVTLPAFEHDFLHYGYLFPFMLVLGLVAAFRQLRLPRRFTASRLAFLGAALFLSVIAVRRPIGWDQRFMIWLVPTLGILALTVVERLSPRWLVRLAVVAAVLALANVGLALTVEYDRLFPRSVAHLASTGTMPGYLDVPNRRYSHMNEGYGALDRAATPADSILYVGTDDSWMYPLWGPRFSRHVEGVWNAEHAAARIASGRFRFVVVEDGAEPAIRAAAEGSAVDAGYMPLVEAAERTIFVRDDAVTPPGSDA